MTSRPYDHLDVVISGTLRSTDQWSTQFTCAAVDHSELPGDTSVGDLIAVSDDTWTALNSGVSVLLKSFLSTVGTIEAVRTYLRKAGDTHATFVGEHVAQIVGTGTAGMPNQIALCVTTQTGAAGRANRGRSYWPYLIAPLPPSNTNLGNFTTDFADLIAAIRTSTSSVWGTAAGPVVGNNGLLITRVRADNVLDTQRRRRNKQVATFSSIVDVPIP